MLLYQTHKSGHGDSDARCDHFRNASHCCTGSGAGRPYGSDRPGTPDRIGRLSGDADRLSPAARASSALPGPTLRTGLPLPDVGCTASSGSIRPVRPVSSTSRPDASSDATIFRHGTSTDGEPAELRSGGGRAIHCPGPVQPGLQGVKQNGHYPTVTQTQVHGGTVQGTSCS